MSLLGKKVRDTVTGFVGTAIEYIEVFPSGVYLTLTGDDIGVGYRIPLGRVVEIAPPVALAADAVPVAVETAPAKTAPAKTAPAKTAPAEIAPAEIAPAEIAPAEIAPAETPEGTAAMLYAQVKAAFLKLGQTGKREAVKQILASQGVDHAKKIEGDVKALRDVLARAQTEMREQRPFNLDG